MTSFSIQLQWIVWLTAISSSSSSLIAKPNCVEKCGGVSIPYPFGMGANCFDNPFYEIFCNYSFEPPKPFLHYYHLELTNITMDHILSVLSPPIKVSEKDGAPPLGLDFNGSPYRISNQYNDLLVMGCSGSVVMRDKFGQFVGGCSSYCVNPNSTINVANCHGVGCCLSPITYEYQIGSLYVRGSEFYEIAADQVTQINHPNVSTLVATLITNHQYYGEGSTDNIIGNLSLSTKYPTILEWYVNHSMHTHNGHCYPDGEGMRCYCKDVYEGNPYLPQGCQVIEECRNCPHHCSLNTNVQYDCEKISWLRQPLVLGLGTSIGLVLVIIGCYWLYKFIKWRIEMRRKAKCFERNGGLLLQQQMSCDDGIIEKMTVFTVSELEKATDNFHENRILGQGGQGTVYKGMLMDGRLVAIKKSTKVDEDQLDQFINEVVILSQINHRNVVKLLGCCLETNIPWLVSEFIPNGTLYQHIHDPTEDFHVGWKMRLQIATESAGALAYLHSSAYAPIYHRDIKSSNILLDDKYRAKVSDFGTSRAINIDQTHVTTRVQGTYGYLDPEYFQSNQFTEKSDVYSFGVVLVELLTGKKSIFHTNSGGWKSLAVEFVCQMDMSRLFDMVDTRVAEEGKKEEFIAIADLAKRCLEMNGKHRPTMNEVATTLHDIRSPNPKEPNSVSGKCVTEISNNDSCTTEMFFTSTGSLFSSSIEVQPLMFDTQ